MMKKENMFTILGVIVFILSVGSLIFYEIYSSRLSEFFIAAIGMLTFTSIFYSFTISKDVGVFETAHNYLEKRKQIFIKDITQKKLSKEKNLPDFLKNVSKDIENIENAKGYLNLHLWLFVSTLGYFLSILTYLMRGFAFDWTTFFQIASFWVGFYSSLVIVCVWFLAHRIMKLSSNKKK